MLGYLLSPSGLNPHEDIISRVSFLCFLQTSILTKETRRLPGRHMGRWSPWETGRIAVRLIHVGKPELPAGDTEEGDGSSSTSSNDLHTGVKGCLPLLSTCIQEPTWATPAFPSSPHGSGAALASSEASQGPPSTRSAGKSTAQGLVSGDMGKQDSRISTLALENPHSKILLNSHLPSSWLP